MPLRNQIALESSLCPKMSLTSCSRFDLSLREKPRGNMDLVRTRDIAKTNLKHGALWVNLLKWLVNVLLIRFLVVCPIYFLSLWDYISHRKWNSVRRDMLTEDTPPSPEQVVRPSAWMPLRKRPFFSCPEVTGCARMRVNLKQKQSDNPQLRLQAHHFYGINYYN